VLSLPYQFRSPPPFPFLHIFFNVLTGAQLCVARLKVIHIRTDHFHDKDLFRRVSSHAEDGRLLPSPVRTRHGLRFVTLTFGVTTVLRFRTDHVCCRGRAIAQAVSRWLPTAAARVQNPGHVEFVVDKVALGQVGFLRVLGFPLPIYIPPISPQSPSPITVFRNLFLLAAHHDSTRHTKMLFPSKTHDIRQLIPKQSYKRQGNPC
jgi:hypothetical protein